MSFMFTVFTSTYNRAYVLRRAFNSLQQQTFKDFEWVVVDDGSTDDTERLVRDLAQEALFPVRYFFQPHGHTKKAINRGAREAGGELFIFLDSDDELMPNALERINFYWQKVSSEKHLQICGIFGLCQYVDGGLVGRKFPQDCMKSSLNEILFRHKAVGERAAAIVTSVLRQYSFPENIPGLVPEGTVFVRMARKYQAIFVNEVFRVYHSSDDSITPKKRFGDFIRNRAEGRALCASEILSHEIKKYFFYNPKQFFVEAIMYVRSALHIKRGEVPKISCFWGRLLVFILYPFGFLLACFDRMSRE